MDELHDHLVDKMKDSGFIRELYNKPDVTKKSEENEQNQNNKKDNT